LNQPTISEIVMPHLLFLEPWRRVVGIFDRDEAIVIGTLYIIHPCVRACDLMKRVICARRKLRVVGINLPDAKNSGRCAAIPFLFSKPGFRVAGEPASPGDAAFSKERGTGRANRRPAATARTFKELQLPPH